MKNTASLFAYLKSIAFLCCCALVITSCDDDDDVMDTRRFTVTLQNVSTNTTLQVGAIPDRTAPLSPGLWAIYDNGELFSLNNAASLGTERLAEEGMTSVKTGELSSTGFVDQHGEFSSPGGPDNMPTIGAGESVTFSFDADPGQMLQIMTMFGNSNDWFYAFDDGGLDLFTNGDPIDGDVTSHLTLYDAGTELDEIPGLGITQKPDHPNTIDVGPADPVTTIKRAMARHTNITIPAKSAVLRVSISSVIAQ